VRYVEQVFNEGDSSTEMYIVIEGEVEVERGSASLGFLGAGAFFGETALIEAVSGNANETWRRTRTTRYSVIAVVPLCCYW
jgi:CRP-like cAMP-binding protein